MDKEMMAKYRNIYLLAMNRALVPMAKINVLKEVLANTIAKHEKDPDQKALVEWSKKIRKDHVLYLQNFNAAQKLLDKALKNLISAQNFELLPPHAQQDKTYRKKHYEDLENAFNLQLKNFNAVLFDMDIGNSLAENQVTPDELKSLSVKLQNDWVHAQFIEKLFKPVSSPIRLDLQARAFFERLDLLEKLDKEENYPDDLKDLKEEMKKHQKETEEFKNLRAFRKAYEEFERANEAYKNSLSETARKKAEQKYQKLRELAVLCAPQLIKSICAVEEAENKRLNKLIEENHNLRQDVWKYLFIKKMAAIFHIPIENTNPAKEAGIFSNELEREVEKEVDKAVKQMVDDAGLRNLAKKHDALIYTISPFPDFVENFSASKHTNLFSSTYFDNKKGSGLLPARKKFVESFARGKKEGDWVECQANLDTLAIQMSLYQNHLKSINEFVSDNPLPKMKKVVVNGRVRKFSQLDSDQEKQKKAAVEINNKKELNLADAKKQSEDEVEEKQKLEAAKAKNMLQLNTAELIEKMQSTLAESEYKDNLENQVAYLKEQLNGLNPAIIENQAREVARYFIQHGFLNAIVIKDGSPELQRLDEFKDNDFKQPQVFLENLLKQFKLAEKRVADEKVENTKNYKSAVENFQQAQRQLKLGMDFIFKVVYYSYNIQASRDERLPDLPRPHAISKEKVSKEAPVHNNVDTPVIKVTATDPAKDDFLQAQPSPDQLRESKRKQKIKTEEIELQSLPDMRSRLVKSNTIAQPKPEDLESEFVTFHDDKEVFVPTRDDFLYAQPSPDERRDSNLEKNKKREAEIELTTFTPTAVPKESKRSNKTIPDPVGAKLVSLDKPKLSSQTTVKTKPHRVIAGAGSVNQSKAPVDIIKEPVVKAYFPIFGITAAIVNFATFAKSIATWFYKKAIKPKSFHSSEYYLARKMKPGHPEDLFLDKPKKKGFTSLFRRKDKAAASFAKKVHDDHNPFFHPKASPKVKVSIEGRRFKPPKSIKR